MGDFIDNLFDGMALVPIYSGSFCSPDLTNNTVTFKKRKSLLDPIPAVIPLNFSGDSAGPVVISFQDKGDYKNEVINGASCKISISAGEDFELSSMFVSDEKEWFVQVVGKISFSGWLIPDSCSEPFLAKPYDVTIQATDALGTLKDVPFSETNGVRYKGFKSDLEIISVCLEKTGLSLPLVLGVNTYEATMNTSVSPIAQTFRDCARYQDQDGNPFSCLTVLESILFHWSCRLHQFNGSWQIINVLEKSRGAVKCFNYSSAGVSTGVTYLGNTVVVGGSNRGLKPVDATVEIAKAFKLSTAYYQYGYPSNELLNGSFDDCTPPNLPNHWEAFGIGAVPGPTTAKTSARVDPTTGLATSDIILSIFQGGVGNLGYIYNDTPVQIRANQKTIVSFDAKYVPLGSGPDNDRTLAILIKSNDNKYYTALGGWQDTAAFYNIVYRRSDMTNQLSINFEIVQRDVDYQITIGLKAITFLSGSTVIYGETQINNVAVKPQTVSAQTAPPLGVFTKQTLTTYQTFKRDPILLLHGDETNAQRSSRLSILAASPVTPPTTWKRNSITEATSLLQIVANSELRLHQKPYRIFTGTFRGEGDIDLNTLLQVDLLDAAAWIFLSGEFNPQSNEHTLKFAEVLVDEPDYFEEANIQDYGAEKNKDGISVGQPIGISTSSGGSVGGGGGSQNLQQTLNLGRVGDKMEITQSMQIPIIAPTVINTGNIWIGAGTSAAAIIGAAIATLTDVALSSLANNQVLTYNATSGKWENKTGGGGGGTWGSITGTLSSQTDLNSALLSKQPGLVSGSNIKTINGNSILGSGDLTISGGSSYTLPIATPSTLGGIRIGTGLEYAPATGITQVIATLQDTLNKGRIGDSMKITTSMEIPTAAPTTINSGSVWVGAGTNATIVKRSKVVSVTDQVLTTLAIGTAEAGKYIVSTNASAIAATISTGEALSSVFVRQGGAGKITFTGSGVTVLVKPSKSAKTEGQNAVVEIFYETATRVVITGDLDT